MCPEDLLCNYASWNRTGKDAPIRQCQCGAEGRCKDNDKEASRQSQHDAGAASQKVNADKDSLIGRTISDNDNKENAGDSEEDGIIRMNFKKVPFREATLPKKESYYEIIL